MNLVTDSNREGKPYHNLTGIYVRARGNDGRLGSYDIAELDSDSLTEWLKRDGGDNTLAENCVRIMLGHQQVITNHGQDCPNCPNQGWYIREVNGQPEQEQCQWCHETPDSKFNLAHGKLVAAEREVARLREALESADFYMRGHGIRLPGGLRRKIRAALNHGNE